MGRKRRLGEATCRHCGALFQKRRWNHIYCSQPCSSRHYWSEQKVTPFSRYYAELVKRWEA